MRARPVILERDWRWSAAVHDLPARNRMGRIWCRHNRLRRELQPGFHLNLSQSVSPLTRRNTGEL